MFIIEHFAHFILACARYSHEHHHPLPFSLREYQEAIFQKKQYYSYPLKSILNNPAPTWEALAKLVSFSLEWLKYITREQKNPIDWALQKIKKYSRKRYPYKMILTSQELDDKLDELQKKWTHSALIQVDLWKHALFLHPVPPLLILPHFTSETIAPLNAKISNFLRNNVFDRIRLSSISDALKSLLQMYDPSWGPFIGSGAHSYFVAQSLSKVPINSWLLHFSDHLQEWTDCAKALSLDQWADMLKKFKNQESSIFCERAVEFSGGECINTLAPKKTIKDTTQKEKAQGFSTSRRDVDGRCLSKKLFDKLFSIVLKEQRWACADHQLSEKLALWPDSYNPRISQIEFKNLLYNHQYILLKKILKGNENAVELRRQEAWTLLSRHGQWTNLAADSLKETHTLLEQEFFYQSLVSQDYDQSRFAQRALFCNRSVKTRCAELAWILLWGRLNWAQILLESYSDLREKISNPKVLRALQKQIERSHFSAHKKWKMQFLLISHSWPFLCETIKSEKAYILLAQAWKIGSLKLAQDINQLAAADRLFDPVVRSWCAGYGKKALFSPFDSITQVLPFLYRIQKNDLIVAYFVNHYRPASADSILKNYFKKAKKFWPVGRVACQNKLRKHFSSVLKDQFRKNRDEWIRWAMRRDSPFVLREILGNAPYTPLYRIQQCFRTISLQSLCGWIIEHKYIDLFSDWLFAQSWNLQQNKNITLAGIFQKQSLVVGRMIQELRKHSNSDNTIEDINSFLFSDPKRALFFSEICAKRASQGFQSLSDDDEAISCYAEHQK